MLVGGNFFMGEPKQSFGQSQAGGRTFSLSEPIQNFAT